MAANEHQGHRERLKRRFIENGLDGFEPHQALELYLFYAIPRRDTNPLAHRLLDRYGTVSGVCDAPIDELTRDFGITENAAVLLKLLPELARMYHEQSSAKDDCVNPETIGEVIKQKFIGRTGEVVVLMLCNARGRVIYFDVVAKGSVSSSDFPIRRIVDLAIRHNACTAFIAHNHPSGSLLPSRTDVEVTRRLAQTLDSVGVRLLDHFIVANNQYSSFHQHELL